jgi:hypothetical protein
MRLNGDPGWLRQEPCLHHLVERGATVVETAGSHAISMSNPQVVAKLIEQAQGAAAKQLHARSNRLGCAEIRREKVSSTPYLGRS